MTKYYCDVCGKEEKRLKEVRIPHCKGVVFLTTSQFEDLLDKLGLDAFNLYVERLADFIIDKNAKVKSCYDTILKWVAEDSRMN